MNWTQEDENAILDTITKWVDNDVRPVADEFDRTDTYPHALVEQMKELGLFGATIGEKWGARPVGVHLRPHRGRGGKGLDGAQRHLQFPPDHGRRRGAQRQ